MSEKGIKIVATNRKANHEYFIFDRFEAGLVLKGSEIKSIRAGKMSLAEAYVQIVDGEAWLIDAHIATYDQASIHNHEPRRPRKLLLHRSEINRLFEDVRQKGITIVPLRAYLREGKAKIEIAIGKGKRLYDKRQVLAKRDAEREIERNLRRR